MKKLIIPCLLAMFILTSCTDLLSYFFFGATTTIKEPTKFELPVPTGEVLNHIKQTNETITLLLSENEKVFIYKGFNRQNGKVCLEKDGSLHKEIMKLKKSVSEKDLAVIIKASKKSGYKIFVDVLDEMQINKINKKEVIEPTNEEEEFLKKLNEQ